MTMPSVGALVDFLEAFAPPHLAADWDNVGLLLGDREVPVHSLMTCLTVTASSAREAVEAGAQLVVSHHPILFRGIKRLTTATPEGRLLLSLIRGGVAVYSPHTSLDNTPGGINDTLAQQLGLIEVALRGAAPGRVRARWSSLCPMPTWRGCPMPCSPPERGTSASIASAVIAWQAPVPSSAPRRPTPR